MNGVDEGDRCWFGRFHPAGKFRGRHSSWCPNRATWQSSGLNNQMDESKWCDEHAPDKDFRRRIGDEPAQEAK